MTGLGVEKSSFGWCPFFLLVKKKPFFPFPNRQKKERLASPHVSEHFSFFFFENTRPHSSAMPLLGRPSLHTPLFFFATAGGNFFFFSPPLVGSFWDTYFIRKSLEIVSVRPLYFFIKPQYLVRKPLRDPGKKFHGVPPGFSRLSMSFFSPLLPLSTRRGKAPEPFSPVSEVRTDRLGSFFPGITLLFFFLSSSRVVSVLLDERVRFETLWSSERRLFFPHLSSVL